MLGPFGRTPLPRPLGLVEEETASPLEPVLFGKLASCALTFPPVLSSNVLSPGPPAGRAGVLADGPLGRGARVTAGAGLPVTALERPGGALPGATPDVPTLRWNCVGTGFTTTQFWGEFSVPGAARPRAAPDVPAFLGNSERT